jgi:molybdopterin biosynthesis enzyme
MTVDRAGIGSTQQTRANHRMFRDAAPAALTALPRLRSTLLDLARPVAPRVVAVAQAIGARAAEDVVAGGPIPPRPIALIGGHAVASVETVGASPYTPAIPTRLEPVAAGAALPAGCDAVVPNDAVTDDLGLAAVQQAVAPGENLRRAGEDLAAGTCLVAVGEVVAPHLAPVLAAIGRNEVAIRRPSVAIRHSAEAAPAAAAAGLAAMVGGEGDTTLGDLDTPIEAADLVLLVGGTEIDAADPALGRLGACGRRLGHGVAVTGAETLAWGEIAARPALILPQRPEAILVAWVSLIEPILASLAGASPMLPQTRPLARKLVSRVGMSEIALLGRDGEAWMPLATGDLPWSALARADAFVELPPESEGLAEGTRLAARPLPVPRRRSTP